MGFLFGNQLGDMLMRMEAPCRKCGRVMTFKDGAGWAKSKGISEQVVMCRQCGSVYTINISPAGLFLQADVTKRFSAQLADSQPADTSALTASPKQEDKNSKP